jgi:hypothetical protein
LCRPKPGIHDSALFTVLLPFCNQYAFSKKTGKLMPCYLGFLIVKRMGKDVVDRTSIERAEAIPL